MNFTSYLISIVAALIGVAVGVGLVWLVLRQKTSAAQSALEEARQRTAQADATLAERHEQLEKESRIAVQAEVKELRETIEREMAERSKDLKDGERRLRERESQIDKRLRGLDQREKNLARRDKEAEERVAEAEALRDRQKGELERVSQLTGDQARDILLKRVAEEARDEMDRVVQRIHENAHNHAEEKARKIITLAIHRCCVDQTAESAVSVVQLPSDDLKGRIIGREGRNIRAFEQRTGCDLIIDDTPEAVVVSSFDAVRREIARTALSTLVSDGRIHPGRIEEVVDKAEKEVGLRMREAADKATAEANVRLPRPVLEVVGRLLFRTSYGQNILKHSVECAVIAASIASELGANVKVARRGAFLHDIGKALDHDQEGTHVDLGVELLRRHREDEAVITTVAEHHLDVGQMSSLESVIVQVADAISSSRPGARRENLETYIRRLENLERIADSFEGVEKSFAIHAGRELRIIVQPEKVDDLSALRMAREVADRVQEEMTFPGEIKVTVIRETRATDYAR
jgi:ribonuclease Y